MQLLASKLPSLKKTKLDITKELTSDDEKKIVYEKLFSILDYNGEKYNPPQNVFELDEKYCESYFKYKDLFKNDIVSEPILSEKSASWTVLSDNGKAKYQDIYNNYKTQLKLNWEVEDIQLTKDIDDWKNLDIYEQIFLMYVLAFFASFDGLVNANIDDNLIKMIKIKEAEVAYAKQREMENVHNEMYAKMLSIFVPDEDLRRRLFDSVRTMDTIKAKAEWYCNYINSDKPYCVKLIASAIVEGIFFSGSFASIFWLKTKKGNPLGGLRKSNKYIARDEGTHYLLAKLIYSELKNKLLEEEITKIIIEAVELEKNFIVGSLPCDLLGMNSDDMVEYIKYVADRMLVDFGYTKLYNATNPFDFMNRIDLYSKDNFFEMRNDSYSNSKIGASEKLEWLDKF